MPGPDDRVLALLGRPDYEPMTAREIANMLRLGANAMSARLRRLEEAGTVRRLGTAIDGGRTWALTVEVPDER